VRTSSSALAAALLSVFVLVGCGGSGKPASESSSAPSQAERQFAQRQQRIEARKAGELEEARDAKKRAKKAAQRHRKAAQRARVEAEAEAEEHAKAERHAEKERESTSGIAPLTEEIYEGFTGIDRSNFQVAYEVCGSQPMSQSAKEWHTSDDPSSIAHAYGLEYEEFARAAVEEGCLRAFLDTPAQYEAELNAHSKL
jgi:hypothetical protein